MIIKINKTSAEDCPYNCPFKKTTPDNWSNIECTLFNHVMFNVGYYDSGEYEACYPCQEMFKMQEEN